MAGVLLPFSIIRKPRSAGTAPCAIRFPAARTEALLAGIPVLALRYLHCDPHSETQPAARRAASKRYAGHLQATLARLEACGVFLGTMNELLAKLDAPTAPAAASSERRYLTVTDVVNNPALAAGAQLTDAAIDCQNRRYDLTQRKTRSLTCLRKQNAGYGCCWLSSPKPRQPRR